MNARSSSRHPADDDLRVRGAPSAQGATVLVVAGGDPVDSSTLEWVLDGDSPAAVVAADSGIDRAREIGVAVDVAVGDFDSVSADGLEWARRGGARLVEYPSAKDETDLELALLTALDLGPARLVVCCIGGGRADHHLANLLLVADRRFASVAVDACEPQVIYSVVQDIRTLIGRPGEVVTLLPLGGDAHGVRTRGLRYALEGETLGAGSPRGVSNEFLETAATIVVDRGTVVAVRVLP